MKKMLAVVGAVVLGACLAMAQTFRGEINGTVTDSSGASVSGADVKATQTGTGLERSTVTDDSGSFNLPELPLGDYTVTITKSGFKTQKTNGVQVRVGAAPRVNAQPAPGEVNQAVEVTAEERDRLVDTCTGIVAALLGLALGPRSH